MNLLDNLSQGVLGYGIKLIDGKTLDWLGLVIQWLIEGTGIIGVGIIVFTLILKTIVLPLDIYSRIKTKKQALIMEKMRPQMEKLQKQYANDKNLYQQKVMDLQKKSGYSMLSACLPMVVSLVIFMWVFSAFSAYAQFATLESYNQMVRDYNSVVGQYVISDENPSGFLKETTLSDGSTDYYVDFTAFAAAYTGKPLEEVTEQVENGVYTSLMTEYREATGAEVADGAENSADIYTREAVRMTLVSYYIDDRAAEYVAEQYMVRYTSNSGNHFLWVRNIWYPDSMLSREIPDFASFRSTVSSATVDDSYEQSYNKVTADLTQQKQNYNGYFILIILSIGIMLLQQFVAMRSNKATNELSSVDGSAQRTTKYMMILMPIVYGVFAFMYSSAFSIYMITNTTYSLITTLIINKAMNVWFSKKETEYEHRRMQRKK